MGVTLITGASSGIGRALARRMALGGDPVAVLARRMSLLEELVAEIEAAGGRALAVACDVTDPTAVGQAVREVEQRLGPVECLVANAGGGGASFVDEFSAAQIEAVIDLNVMGAARCIEAVLPGMLERGAGHLVATSSLAGYRGLPTTAAYSAAKAALTNMMESLRIDLAPRGVAVTVIAPGFVRVRPRKPGSKRKVWKPMQVELESAAALMERAIRARSPYLAFPRPMVWLSALARMLPARLYDRLLSGRVRRPRR